MWQLVVGGRSGFAFEGDALIDFVRRCIAELLSRGAIPVIGGGGTDYYWVGQKQHGSKPEEIIENVVREWLTNGARTKILAGCGSLFADPSRPSWNRDSGSVMGATRNWRRLWLTRRKIAVEI